MERQILVDPHSPSQYRVWGTIQNFPAFKDAFHCQSTAYAPDKHCDVWVSDIDSCKSDKEVKPAVNVSADPCTDFWQYACGKYDKLVSLRCSKFRSCTLHECFIHIGIQMVSFHFADANNLQIMAGQLNSPSYQATIKNSTALTKEKQFSDACIQATLDNTTTQSILVNKNYLKPRVCSTVSEICPCKPMEIDFSQVDALAGFLGSTFTYVYGGTVNQLPNPTQLANAMAYLSFNQGIDTLVTPLVDTNWADPTKGYRMFLDQNTAYMSKTYYQPDAFKTVKDDYVTSTTKIITRFMREQNLTVNANLRDQVQGLIEFEQMIANTYSTDDTTRRTYARSWNLKSIDDVQKNYPFIDWKTYISQVQPSELISRNTTVPFGSHPTQYAKFNSDYSTLDKTKLINYLFMRLLLQNVQYLPTYADTLTEMPVEPLVLGRKRRVSRFGRSDQLADTQASCAGMANDLMQFANGRVFIDYLYPDQDSKAMIREKAGGVIKNVIHSFQGMIEELNWMTPDIKKKAIEKTNGIVQNIAFPDWIMDNKQLDAYYNDLTFDPTKENYYDMWTKLIIFNLGLQYKQLNAAATDRNDFLGQPGTVNAWYQPELNSITFPAGILQPPYFHPQWPASINYGGMGLVAGHELTHGFDDEGVQWGPGGEIAFPANQNCTGWMDEQSTAGFNSMAQCVINGIHAAFRAYRTHIALNGPDPLLPDRLFGQFTHDQLFFLNFAQVWCEKQRTDDLLYKQLMVDPHSPSKYRVFGTIQNYPAFRVAYNCPINSVYSPSQHCSVWVTENEP
ncbi:unnamed protein product [Haemonchus placei]|uniref:Peptidase_M13 domain-containing protein n=1 Tax=Haemonchus placei TaxID=6290 RepID=A0A0N4WUN5_HAEPC|nr:unnamed protein product [Haemonchus placei]